MKSRNRSRFINHPVFWLSLGILLVNDHYLKIQFHNWLTGKLSDVVGLILLALVFALFFNGKALKSVMITGLLFVFWKTPFSQPFIDVYNEIAFIQIYRVIDYTDYFTLVILFFPYFLIKKKEETCNKNISSRKLTIPALVLCSFAFMATSPPHYAYNYQASTGNLYLNNSRNVRLSKSEILSKLSEEGWHAYQDTLLMNHNTYLRYDAEQEYIKLIEADSSKYRKEIINKESIYNGYKQRVEEYKIGDIHSAHYKIDQLIVGADTINELQFSLLKLKKNKTKIIVHSARVNQNQSKSELRKQYYRILKTYLKDNLRH